jgi:hypothetical protein
LIPSQPLSRFFLARVQDQKLNLSSRSFHELTF